MTSNHLTSEKRKRIVEILCNSFDENPSVNFVLKQDNKRRKRLSVLMEYSLFQGEKFGRVYLSDDNLTCAIVLYSNNRKSSFSTVLWDLRLISQSMGLSNVSKVLKREKLIKKHHPNYPFTHLWYIGVDPKHQGKGLGKNLMAKILSDAKSINLPIYLETSNPKNFPFYENLGFKQISSLDSLGYDLRMFIYEL